MPKKVLLLIALIISCAAVYAPGALPGVQAAAPDGAQVWEEPWDRADLLLFSTHADDEHLFFAGILPHAVANGVRAQVVYMTNHNDNKIRETERLDGLYAVGIRNKPIVAHFPDLYSESLEEAERGYARASFSKEDFIIYCVENIRRFKPQVAVGHDINGEYGHGGHMLAAVSLTEAVALAGDETFHPESYALYGVWDTPKTYIHLWPERPVRLDIDSPLEYFDGLTAFEVSQYGFSFHKSQHWTWFNEWLNGAAGSPISLSTQIRSYPPGKFGLYRTTVGGDPEDAVDFYANITLWKDYAEDTSESGEPGEPDGVQSPDDNGPPIESGAPDAPADDKPDAETNAPAAVAAPVHDAEIPAETGTNPADGLTIQPPLHNNEGQNSKHLLPAALYIALGAIGVGGILIYIIFFIRRKRHG